MEEYPLMTRVWDQSWHDSLWWEYTPMTRVWDQSMGLSDELWWVMIVIVAAVRTMTNCKSQQKEQHSRERVNMV